MASITEDSMFPLRCVELAGNQIRTRDIAADEISFGLPAWKLPADKFLPPKEAAKDEGLTPLVKLLNHYEKSLRRYGRWSFMEIPHLLRILDSIEGFMQQYVQRARNSQYVELMKEVYYRHGIKFRRVYTTIVQDVIMSEPGFDDFVRVVSEKEPVCNSAGLGKAQFLEPSSSGNKALLPLYMEAFIAQEKLLKLGERLERETGAKVLPAPLKKMWRCLEKMILKYASPGDDNGSAGQLKDIARLAIQGDMRQLLAAFILLWEATDVRVVRIKNRFAEPPQSGWADCQLMLTFQEDERQHICEIQLVHPQLFVVRKTMGAHKEYVKLRSAEELMNIYEEELPDLTK
eukprot:TRINITY_DN32008_c0_g1_i1.p1 TRINITY_DN32008_c0_g1~~TRINITY_DN32008_c0_g1_i1.p1  ORF type:complete len:371 (+),score=85.25 TRINITY_DN32008_c0_g1_i1:78-1115(+)